MNFTWSQLQHSNFVVVWGYGLFHVVLAILELTMETRLALNLQTSLPPSPSEGVLGLNVCATTLILVFILKYIPEKVPL